MSDLGLLCFGGRRELERQKKTDRNRRDTKKEERVDRIGSLTPFQAKEIHKEKKERERERLGGIWKESKTRYGWNGELSF